MRAFLILFLAIFTSSCGLIPTSYQEYDTAFLHSEIHGRFSNLLPQECKDLYFKAGKESTLSPEKPWKQCIELLPQYLSEKQLAIKAEHNQRLQELESLGNEARRKKEVLVKSDQFPETVFSIAGLDQAFARDCYRKGGMSLSEYEQYIALSEEYVKKLTKSSYDYSRTTHWRAYNEKFVVYKEKAGNSMCNQYRKDPEIYKRPLQQYEELAEKFRH